MWWSFPADLSGKTPTRVKGHGGGKDVMADGVAVRDFIPKPETR